MTINPYKVAFTEGWQLRADTLAESMRGRRLYAIFVIPRSGSTWLTELAKGTGLLGCPQEWLNFEFCQGEAVNLGCPPPRRFGTLEINSYVRTFVDFSVSPNGVAGIELSWPHIAALQDACEPDVTFSFLYTSFFLRRRDLLAQAISLYRSVASGLFHSYQDEEALRKRFASAEYDDMGIASYVQHLVDCEVEFSRMFERCDLSPVPLFYEDLVADQNATLRRLTDTLKIASPQALPATSISKLSDSRSAEWAERFWQQHGLYLEQQMERRPAF